MWTRLVAGAAAHDINNLTQGLFNLLSLATAPTTSPESLARYAALARDGIKDLQGLGRDLRTLADLEVDREPQRLDLAASDAAAEVTVAQGRQLVLAPAPGPVLVDGNGAALRLAIRSVLRYAVSASAPDGVVRASLDVEGRAANVVVEAESAPRPRWPEEVGLARIMGGPERAFASHAGLVLAGAATESCGGEIKAGPGANDGLRFKLSFRRADTGA